MRRPFRLVWPASLAVCVCTGCGPRERPQPRLVETSKEHADTPPPSESPRPKGRAPEPGDPSEPVLALLAALPELPEGIEIDVEGAEDDSILPKLQTPQVGATRLFIADDRIDAMWRFAGLSSQGGPMPVGAEVFSSFDLDNGQITRWTHYPCRSIIQAQTSEVRSPPGVADVGGQPPEVFTMADDAKTRLAAQQQLAAWGRHEFELDDVAGAGYLLHDMGSGRQVQSTRDAQATLADAFKAFGDAMRFSAVDHRAYGAYTVTHATAEGEGHAIAFVVVHRFDAGKLVETWLYLDRASLPKPAAIPSEPQIAQPPFRGE